MGMRGGGPPLGPSEGGGGFDRSSAALGPLEKKARGVLSSRAKLAVRLRLGLIRNRERSELGRRWAIARKVRPRRGSNILE